MYQRTCVFVCLCKPGCKGEFQVGGVNSPPTDGQKCGSYPAEPSPVICASMTDSFAPSCALLCPASILFCVSKVKFHPQTHRVLLTPMSALPIGLAETLPSQHFAPTSHPPVPLTFTAKTLTHRCPRFINTRCR